ncbi:hypothetical protein [Flavobacterium sp. MDT1-60]|nr:hypothetical protein [Flavobacterium sp. MDT1-60]
MTIALHYVFNTPEDLSLGCWTSGVRT